MLQRTVVYLTSVCLPVALAALAACSQGSEAHSSAPVDGVASLGYEELLAHVQPTAEHPATLINFWATW